MERILLQVLLTAECMVSGKNSNRILPECKSDDPLLMLQTSSSTSGFVFNVRLTSRSSFQYIVMLYLISVGELRYRQFPFVPLPQLPCQLTVFNRLQMNGNFIMLSTEPSGPRPYKSLAVSADTTLRAALLLSRSQ